MLNNRHFIKFYEYYFEKLNSVDEIIIFGWSAGDVDIPYLCKIRDSISKNTRWTAYFYDNESKEKIVSAFIENNIHNYCLKLSEKFWI